MAPAARLLGEAATLSDDLLQPARAALSNRTAARRWLARGGLS